MTKLWGLRWWMMGLLMVGSIINYLTRSTLAVAAPTVLKDLDITTQQYSWILSGFQFAIMLQPICGYVMDTHRPEARVRHLRDRLVVHQHGARPGRAAGRRSSACARSSGSPKARPTRPA